MYNKNKKGDKMLHNEARELIVKAYERSHNAKEVARNFGVHRSTVHRLVKQMKETGNVELQTNKRGRHKVLNEKDMENIRKAVEEQPDITIDEIIEKLQLSVCNETVRKAVINLGFVYKKKSFYAAERERPRRD